MRIIIMGCGRVGAQLATLLDKEGHQVTVLDNKSYSFRWLPMSFKGTALLGHGLDEVSLKKAGIESIRVHDLRHSYATIRLLKGHNIGDVSYQLGHASIKITYDVYAHWIPGSFKDEIDELDSPSEDNLKTEEKELTGR